MAGRGRVPRQAFEERWHGYSAPPERSFVQGPVVHPSHPAGIEDELELQMLEIRRLLVDNHQLVEDRMSLHREMIDTQEGICRVNMVIADIHAETETHTRELIEKNLKLEADLRAAESLREEGIHLRSQIKKLTSTKQELTNQVQSMTQELTIVRADNQQILTMKAEIDKLHQELMHVWTDIEYEKKGNYKLMEQKQSMEKILISMTCEIEKLRADLATMDGRPWVVGGGGIGMKFGSPEDPIPSRHGDGYATQPLVADKPHLYDGGPGSWGTPDQSHVARR